MNERDLRAAARRGVCYFRVRLLSCARAEKVYEAGIYGKIGSR